MEEVGRGCLMSRVVVGGWMFLLVQAHPGSPGQRAIKRVCVCVCVGLVRWITFESTVPVDRLN